MESYSNLFSKKKIHHKKIPLTPTPFELEMYCCSRDDFNDLLTSKYRIKKDLFKKKIDGAGAITVYAKNKLRRHFIVAIFQNSIYNTSHEAVHISYFLDRVCEFNFNKDNHESQAYYVGYITQEIGKFLKEIDSKLIAKEPKKANQESK